jgi:ABC-type branched-subunit amino acid transport system substrate-binding protein
MVRARRGAQLATAAALTTLVVAGCGGAGGSAGADVPGVTEHSIKLGTTQPLTGPAAPGYSKISKVMAAYFKHVNAEGGINGRTIDLIVEDDGYNPSETVDKTRKLVLQDKVFAIVGGLGTPTHSAVLNFLRQNKVPDLMVSSGSLSWNQPEKYPDTFGWSPDYVREGKILARYATTEFPDQTYCAFGQGDDLGADGVKGLEIILGHGVLKASESYAVSNSNIAPQIGKLQAAGCDVVFSFSVPGFTALALSTAAQLGYHAQWVVSSVGADPAALKGYLKADAEKLTQGVLTANYLPGANDTSNSWTRLFAEINDKYNDGAAMDATAMHGYALAYAAAEAIAASGKDLTREEIVKAIEGGIPAGPSLTPYAYSSDNHAGMTGVVMIRIKDLTASQVSPVYVTDDGQGAVKEYTEPQAEAPENGVPQG